MNYGVFVSHVWCAVHRSYRLASFGFFADSANTDRDRGSTGNFGIQDQRIAMQWVQREISAFGGDPARVLLFGESAGGISSMLHAVCVVAGHLPPFLCWFY